MYLEYSHTRGGNFGDDLNPWLWRQLIPECLDENDGTALVGIGTLLDQRRVERSLHRADRIVVFSSGAGPGAPPEIDDHWHIYCVRGPYTARHLGLPSSAAIVDGAFLLRTLELPTVEKKYRVAFMPHHGSETFVDWRAVCEHAGIAFISAKQPVDDVLEELLGSNLLITEAMHGAISADALRIPWIPVRYSPKFLQEKWLDFAQSVGVEVKAEQLSLLYQRRMRPGKLFENLVKTRLAAVGIGPDKWQTLPLPLRVDPARTVETLARELSGLAANGRTVLSSDATAERLTAQLQEKLEVLQTDYADGKLTADVA